MGGGRSGARAAGQKARPQARRGVVQEITRMVIEKAQRETRFIARAARIDSTVVEADIQPGCGETPSRHLRNVRERC